ncbi:hypothetical protein [Pseudoalteromonas denitrificans]|uniref:Uncharacterized protein n=1 Tax=Pseudoalteromonas denitrificans DSM 6059 TaxID=1123010 RepID=A0A1I1TNQ6_9GAMM|nr:hypothetical protein [Pseudoalteromonas denitrificans]SFD60262.1 hypothetical protein SAMN02745724_04948 [Pseudoalteromonas denitrificans DSM 6059]
MRLNIKKVMLGFMPILAIFLLAFWYQSFNNPLTQAEVKHYINLIKNQPNNPGKHDISALSHFLANDDGKSFYTVNLYQYNIKADYSNAALNQISGRKAFNKFSKVMIKLLAQQGSHPIFGSDWRHELTTPWHRVVIVRYRSRRDIAEIFIKPEFIQASEHKWAGLAKNERMLVQGLHIPEFSSLFIFAVMIVSILLFTMKVLKRK